MSQHAPRLIDVIICDEVRQENNGKLLIIGMYLDNIGVPRIPFVLPTLSFLCKWRGGGGVPLAGTFRVASPSNRVVQEFDLPAASVSVPAGRLLLTTFRFQPFPVEETGQYRLVFKPKGGRSRTAARLDVHTGQVPGPDSGRVPL